MMQKILLYMFAFPAISMAAPPSWWSDQDTVKKEGSVLTILCRGGGADKSLSYREALIECKAIASEHLRDMLFRIQATTIESEQAVAYHAEQSMNAEVTGLFSRVEKEFTEQQENGEFVTYIQYRADTSHARVKNIEQSPTTRENGGKIVQGDDGGALAADAIPTAKSLVRGEDRLIILSIVPGPCDLILVRGKFPRPIKCTESPVTLHLRKGDSSVIIRKTGYKTKRLKIDLNRASQETGVESVQIQMERL